MANKASATTETSFLLDKTPPEIRLMIFRLVLRTTHHVVKNRNDKTQRDTKVCTLLDTSLFLVNRAISQEAKDSFFEVNTLRLNSTTPRTRHLQDIRRLEITGDVARQFCSRSTAWKLDAALHVFARLPKLQSVTIMCGVLKELEETVRDFAMRTFPLNEVHCVGLGVFEVFEYVLPVKGQIKIYLNILETTTTLAEARTLLSKHPNLDLSDPRDPIASGASMSTRALADALKWYHKWRIVQSNPDALDGKEVNDVNSRLEFLEFLSEYESLCPWKHDMLPENVKLEDLAVEEHGAEVVEWATNLMAMNLSECGFLWPRLP